MFRSASADFPVSLDVYVLGGSGGVGVGGGGGVAVYAYTFVRIFSLQAVACEYFCWD